MNPIAALRAPDAGARPDESRPVAKAKQPAADFSTLLALLAGTGPRVRQAVMNSLSGADRSLLDKLLDAAGSGTAEGASMLDAAGSSSTDGVDSQEMNTLSQAASDEMRYGAMRYGAMRHGATATEERSADARAALLAAISQNSGTNGSGGTELQRALSRAATRRTSAQLLARGDGAGASVRGALDSILDRAGTDAAAALAMLRGSTMPAGAAIASTGAATVASGDVNDVNRDANALQPEFRSRLERVIERMKSEYGHDVGLVETARSQERQDFLYEQGRTRPGQVVTWTHDSAHTRGEAADVTIDGSYDNATGFARLQRIAREEGLRTLGVKDPGHLELPRDGRAAENMLDGAARVSNRIEHTAAANGAGVSGVAQVAGVAGVAGVARVAERSLRAIEPAVDGALPNAAENAAHGAQTAGTKSGADSRSDAESSNGRSGSREPRRAGAAGNAVGTDANGAANASSHSASSHSAAITGTPNALKTGDAPSTAASAAQRATDAQDLRESAPGSLSRLTMQVDGANGDDRITIDLRGRNVGTHITTDANTADGLRARTGELQDALGRHGLDADTVRISNSARTDAGDASRAAGSERDALKLAGASQGSAGDAATSNGSRERAPAHRDFDKDADARRAREEQKEQDARRRGQGRNFNEGQR